MKTAPIRRPVSRALILHAGLPAVSLCYTAGFIPSRLRRCILAHASPVQRRRRDGTELLFGMASDSLSRVVLDERRRRGGIEPGVKRSDTPEEPLQRRFRTPDRGDGEGGAR